jgi:hypothetical protein
VHLRPERPTSRRSRACNLAIPLATCSAPSHQIAASIVPVLRQPRDAPPRLILTVGVIDAQASAVSASANELGMELLGAEVHKVPQNVHHAHQLWPNLPLQ